MSSKRSQPQDAHLDLESFFPYRLSVLNDEVSRCVAQVYTERFDLTRHQWRVLAVLGARGELSAKEICERTRMEKMQVSRAVAQLETEQRLVREVDPSDRRHLRLRLAPQGRALYRRIVPLVRERERFILAALGVRESKELERTMNRLLERALVLSAGG